MMEVFEKMQVQSSPPRWRGSGVSAYGVLEAKPVPGSNGKLYEAMSLVEKPRPEDAPSTSR